MFHIQTNFLMSAVGYTQCLNQQSNNVFDAEHG